MRKKTPSVSINFSIDMKLAVAAAAAAATTASEPSDRNSFSEDSFTAIFFWRLIRRVYILYFCVLLLFIRLLVRGNFLPHFYDKFIMKNMLRCCRTKSVHISVWTITKCVQRFMWHSQWGKKTEKKKCKIRCSRRLECAEIDCVNIGKMWIFVQCTLVHHQYIRGKLIWSLKINRVIVRGAAIF